MNAVIKTGGKQYNVSEKDIIYVEKLDVEEGKTVTFDEVLALGDKIGTPLVEGAKVSGKVLKHGKGKKIIVFKYRPKKDSRTKKGHRQNYTKVEITKIG
ncbi:MAG: 50S ribosomal protein L21 [Mycoplasmatales bacterium]